MKLTYSLFGVGVESPYRIRPFLGARIPMNSSYSPKLSIYNPESSAMQIMEMYSSTSKLQITLGTMLDAPDVFSSESLQVGPFEEKEVGFASYMGLVSGLQNAFIRIKVQPDCTSEQLPPEKNLIIPVEVEVSDVPGIYASTAVIDFGIVRQSDTTKRFELDIMNSGKGARNVEINWIRQTPIKELPLKIDYKSGVQTLHPNENKYTTIAILSFDYQSALEQGKTEFDGFIRVHVKNSGHVEKYKDLDIPWKAKILDGNLEIETSETQFLLSKMKDMSDCTREITVTNTLSDPLVLYKIEIGPKAVDYFAHANIDQPIFIPPHQKSKLFQLSFTKCRNVDIGHLGCPEDINIESTITLHTNASTFTFPLLYYSGMIKYEMVWLEKEFSEKSEKEENAENDFLDFGLTSVDEQKCVIMALHNHNNRVVKVNSFSTDLEGGKFDLWPLSSLHMTRHNGGTVQENGVSYRSIQHKRRGENGFPLVLDRNTTTFLEACCYSSVALAEISATLELVAEFQMIRIPLKGRFSDGRIKVLDPPIVMPPSFPGKKVYAELTVYSTFKETFEISHVVSEAPDNFKWQKYKLKEVKPMTRTKVGKIEFDAGAGCNDCKCIGSLTEHTLCGRQWNERLDKPQTAAKSDADLYRNFQEHFREPIKNSMVMYTKLMTAYDFEVKTDVQWPRVAKQNGGFVNEPIQFPPTVVSAKVTGQRTLVLENPTDVPIIIQPILLGDLEQKYKLEQALKDDYPFLDIPKNAPKYSDDFGIGMNRIGNHKKDGLPHSRPRLYLMPGARENLHLGFLPKESGDHESVLLLRNNLTVVEPIRLIGRGIRENLTLLNGNDIFIMSMRDEDLKECYDHGGAPFRKGSTTKIKIQNYSSIGSKIRSIKINNETCSGSGWEVIDCKNGALPATFVIPAPPKENGVKEIKLKYRPDFSMLETSSKMTIETEYGAKFPFTLTAKIPEKHIEACRAAIPRPPWEPACRRIILIMMVVLLVGILLMGWIEASYIVEPWLVEVKSRCAAPVAAISTLAKLYPEYVRRPKLIPSPVIPKPLAKTAPQAATRSGTNLRKTSSSSTDSILLKSAENGIKPRRFSKSIDSLQNIKNSTNADLDEELPAWADEPVSGPDGNLDDISKEAEKFEKEMANYRPNGIGGKGGLGGTPQSGRESPSGSLSSMQSSIFPASDISTSDLNKNGDQSNSSLEPEVDSDRDTDSDHGLLNAPSRNDMIRQALFPVTEGIFDRRDPTPPVKSDPLGLTGLRTLEPNFDPAPGPPRRHYPPMPPGYHMSDHHYRHDAYPYYGGAYPGRRSAFDGYERDYGRAALPPQYRQRGHHEMPLNGDPVRRAQDYIAPLPPSSQVRQQSGANYPPPGFEHSPRGDTRHHEQWPNNDHFYMPEDQRRKLREDVEKEGYRFDFKNIWDKN